MSVTQKEICEVLRRPAQNSHETYHHRIDLADRIDREGIAPQSVDALIAEIDILPTTDMRADDWLRFSDVHDVLANFRSKP